MPTDSIEFDDDDKHYAAVGKIASMWAYLELSIDFIVWYLADVDDEQGAAITSQFFSPIPRLEALIALAHINGVSPKTISKLESFANELRGLVKKRNRYIHDPLILDKKNLVSTIAIATKVKKGAPFKSDVTMPFDLAEALKFASDIRSKITRLNEIAVLVKSDAEQHRKSRKLPA